MRFRYDLHLHSCLSPCGDEEMTPYNMVNLAKLFELDIIALTDHNTAGNCRSAVQAGADAGITVVPGMELCTAEEVHMVCLFPDCDRAEAFGAYIRGTLPPIRNKPEVFGRQLFMDATGGVLGEEDALLIMASGVSIDDAPALCAEYGGVCYPAHIDRSSNSVLSNLGSLMPQLGFRCTELSKTGDLAALTIRHPELTAMRILYSSDAHYLHDMTEARDTIGLPENTAPALVKYLSGLHGGKGAEKSAKRTDTSDVKQALQDPGGT